MGDGFTVPLLLCKEVVVTNQNTWFVNAALSQEDHLTVLTGLTFGSVVEEEPFTKVYFLDHVDEEDESNCSDEEDE